MQRPRSPVAVYFNGSKRVGKRRQYGAGWAKVFCFFFEKKKAFFFEKRSKKPLLICCPGGFYLWG
jgi:hypothetical protein